MKRKKDLIKIILIVIDMQNGVIEVALVTKALVIVDAVKEKILSYPADTIIATMDTHFENYIETQEGKYLPVSHCIKGSNGWKVCPEIVELLAGAKI